MSQLIRQGDCFAGRVCLTKILGIRGITELRTGCDLIVCPVVGAVFEDDLSENLQIGQGPHGVEGFFTGEDVGRFIVQSNVNPMAGCLSPSLGHTSASACAWLLPHYTPLLVVQSWGPLQSSSSECASAV